MVLNLTQTLQRIAIIASPIILNLPRDGRKWEYIRRFPSSSEEEGRIKRNRRKHQFSLERRRRISPPTPTGMAANCKTLYNITRAHSLSICVRKVRAQRVSSHVPDTFILLSVAKLQRSEYMNHTYVEIFQWRINYSKQTLLYLNVYFIILYF